MDMTALPARLLLGPGSLKLSFGPDDVMVGWSEAMPTQVMPHPGAGTWDVEFGITPGASAKAFPMIVVVCPVSEVDKVLQIPKATALAMLVTMVEAMLEVIEKKKSSLH